MLFGSYRFCCRFESEAHLPPYKGSTLRGVFGRALKSVVCRWATSVCPTCPERDRCLHVLTFETQLNAGLPRTKHVPEPPNPYVIEPPPETRSYYPAGSHFEFTLLLFGEINHNLPYYIFAFDRFGRKGIGRQANAKSGLYQVHQVALFGDPVFDGNSQTFQSTPRPRSLRLAPEPTGEAVIETLTVTLTTPLRLKFKNRLNPDLPFHVLVRALLRRAAALMGVHGTGEPPLDYPALALRAATVEVAHSTLQWVDWRRYSFRQEAAMSLGGLIGSITYRDVPAEFLPLLRFGELAHIGKETTFGLGKMELTHSDIIERSTEYAP